MHELQGNALTFLFFYTESKVGKTGLTVTADVREGSTTIITAGACTEIGGGLYAYTLSSGSVDANELYTAIGKTATTSVDQQHIPALWVVGRTWTTRLDMALSAIDDAVWAYATRTLTQSLIAASASVSGDSITQYRGDTWAISTTIAAFSGYSKLWFTLKQESQFEYYADSEAVIQILEATSGSEGLLYVNGAAAADSSLGSITVVSAAAGTIIINLDETITAQLTPNVYSFDLQCLISGAITTLASGLFIVLGDTTRTTS